MQIPSAEMQRWRKREYKILVQLTLLWYPALPLMVYRNPIPLDGSHEATAATARARLELNRGLKTVPLFVDLYK